MVFSTGTITIGIMGFFCSTLNVRSVSIGHRTSTNKSTTEVLGIRMIFVECSTGRLIANTGRTFATTGDTSCTGDIKVIHRRCAKLRHFASGIQHCPGGYHTAISRYNSCRLHFFPCGECCHSGMPIRTVSGKDSSFVDTCRSRPILGGNGRRDHPRMSFHAISGKNSSFVSAFCTRNTVGDSGECDHSGGHIHAISGKGCVVLNSFSTRYTSCSSGECNHSRRIHAIACENDTFLIATGNTSICSGERNNMRLSIRSITSKHSSFGSRSTGYTSILGGSGISRHSRVTISTVVGKGFANKLTIFADMVSTGIASNNSIRTTSCCIGDTRSCSIEDRRIIEGTATFATCHLVPQTSVCCGNNTVGNIGFLILRGIEHVDRRFLSICANRCRADMTTGNLSSLQLEALHVGHVVAEAPIGNVTSNSARGIRRSGRDGRDGIAVEGSTVSRSNTAKGSAHKSGATAESHSLAAFHDGITDIGVGAEFGSKSCSKSRCCSAGSGCSCTASCTTEYTARRSCTAANTGDNPGGHHKLHTHTGSGLSYIQAHGGQIAVESLGTLEICQCTEHPEENASLSGG